MLLEAGTLDLLFKKWWKLNKNQKFDQIKKVSWNDSILAFSMFIAVICIATALLVIEVVLVRCFHGINTNVN